MTTSETTTLIISSLSLIISSITIYIAIIGRRNDFRKALYERQFEIAERIHLNVINIEELFIKITYPEQVSEEFLNITDKISSEIDSLHRLYNNGNLFMADDVDRKLGNAIEKLDKEISQQLKHSNFRVGEISVLGFDISYELQTWLGIESLSKENRKVLRSKKWEINE